MCPSVKLLLAFVTVVVAHPEASQGSCLLAKKKVMGQAAFIQEESSSAFEQLAFQQRDWRIRHKSVENAMNESQTLLDKFIAAQSTSSDHCSSRLMESKRILDGILADVRNLNAQVISHEEVLETETENLKITTMSVDAVTTEYKSSIDYCEEERHEAFIELKKYSKELEELDSIANPSMRMKIAHSVTIKRHESLAQVTLDKEMCEAFLDFTRRHAHHKVLDKPAADCDKQREELQEAFEKAYKEIRVLKEDARERTVEKICFTTAETKKTTELVPLVSQRDIAIEKIEVASQAIAAIQPVLNLVKEKAEKLRTHISKTLTPECKEAGEASKVLVRVRELIISLEECPGRNDFKLKIPPIEEPTESPEPANEAEEPTEAPTEAPELATGAEEISKAPEPATKIEEPTETPTEAPEPATAAEDTSESPEPEVPEDDKPPPGAEEEPEPEVPEDDKPPPGAEEVAPPN